MQYDLLAPISSKCRAWSPATSRHTGRICLLC